MVADIDRGELSLLTRQVQHRRGVRINARLEPLGATLSQWLLLRRIAHNPGASTHQLAELTFQTDQACGNLVAKLAARGLVARRSAGGRAIRHELTAAGTALLTECDAIVRVLDEQEYAGLGEEELRAFKGVLQRLLAAIG
jgi:DNA-binding MarR family transcriptional regulator